MRKNVSLGYNEFEKFTKPLTNMILWRNQWRTVGWEGGGKGGGGVSCPVTSLKNSTWMPDVMLFFQWPDLAFETSELYQQCFSIQNTEAPRVYPFGSWDKTRYTMSSYLHNRGEVSKAVRPCTSVSRNSTAIGFTWYFRHCQWHSSYWYGDGVGCRTSGYRNLDCDRGTIVAQDHGSNTTTTIQKSSGLCYSKGNVANAHLDALVRLYSIFMQIFIFRDFKNPEHN